MKKLLFLTILILTVMFVSSFSVHAARTLYAASVGGELPIHISPDEGSFAVAVAPSCAEMKLIEEDGTWGLVSYNNKSGWINLSFSGESYGRAAELTGYECSKNVITRSDIKQTALYTLPSNDRKTGSKEKYVVPGGTVIKITRETASGWALVEMNKEFAWIQIENTEPFVTETEEFVSEYKIYYVYTLSKDGNGTKLYSGIDEKKILMTIQDCVKLTVRKKDGDYAYVSYDGMNGWIKLEDTTKSLSDAQANTGYSVNREYVVTENKEGMVEIFSIPSQKTASGTAVEGSVKCGEQVFVQRSTYDGWCLINHDGVTGWILPGSVKPVTEEKSDAVTILEKFEQGFISTSKNAGAKVYASYDGKNTCATIPECVKVEIISHRGEYRYVRCDYAAGWISRDNLTVSREKAFSAEQWKNGRSYIAKKGARLMSLPTDSWLCGSKKILDISPGTHMTVVRIVTSDKTKWALTRIDGKQGWVDLGKIRKKISAMDILVLVLIAITLIAVFVFGFKFIRKKLKERRIIKDESKEFL